MNELQPLSHIFINKLFRIPDYQRGYAWQHAQLRDFWDDLVNLRADRYHYTGLLSLKMLSQAQAKALDQDDQWLLKKGYRAYHVVDGQQRLTTFVILIHEMLSLVQSLPENEGKGEDQIFFCFERLKDIRGAYISRAMPPADFVTTYIFGYEKDNPSAEYLKYRVFGQKYGGELRETYYTKNLRYAKEFFAKELRAFYAEKGCEGLSELFGKLTLHMMFNIHEIQDDYDVFVAFETMNNRGKKLTNLELLKNRLIYLTTLYGKDTLDDANEQALREKINRAWKEVYYQLGRNESAALDDDEFLRAHWIMFFAYSRKRGDDYIQFLLRKFSHKSIRGSAALPEADADSLPEADEDGEEDADDAPDEEQLSAGFLEPREIADYVNSLNETAEYWYYTFYPEKCDALSAEEKIGLGRLNRVGIGYFRPLVAVSLLPGVDATREERVAFLAAVERFQFISFRMAMFQSSFKSSEYYRSTRAVYKREMPLRDVTDDLNRTTALNEKEAVAGFVSRMNRRFLASDGFYGWRDLRYLLYEYEYALATKYKLEKLDWAVLTHVVRDKLTVEHILPQTPSKAYWRNQFRQFTPEEVRLLSASLGNLLPLSRSINSSLQNDSFADKKTRGYTNGSHSEIEVSKEDDWDARRIYERGMRLLRFMERRWDFHFESAAQMEELLHISFVRDGRALPPEITAEADAPPAAPDATERRHGARLAYWTHALPIIKAAHARENGGPYANVAPGDSNYKDGALGLAGIHLYCGVSVRPRRCVAGLWIDTGRADTSKAAFDALYAHREDIARRMPLPVLWDRKDAGRACSVTVALDDADFSDPGQWLAIARFHADMSKALADAAFYPYADEIAGAMQG